MLNESFSETTVAITARINKAVGFKSWQGDQQVLEDVEQCSSVLFKHSAILDECAGIGEKSTAVMTLYGFLDYMDI